MNDSPESTIVGQAQPAELYQYQALDPARSEFRILQLAPHNSTDHLHGTLEIVSMLDEPKPEYKTMSYAWGETTLSHYISLDQMHLSVPASAHQALNGILCKGYSGAIWIDSVCINQSDEREREQQISMMGGQMGIYSNGRLNLIWLGDSDHFTSEAVKAIQLVLHDMRNETGEHFERLHQTLIDSNSGGDSLSKTPFSIDFDHDAMLAFLDRTWFRRLWVVQEAVLASASIVLCGEFELQLLEILRAARWCAYKFDHLRLGTLYADELLYAPTKLFDLTDRVYGRFRGYSHIAMLDCLRLARAFETTIPLDKIYATLGLLTPSLRELEVLRPDYTKSLAQTLQDVTYAAAVESKWDSQFLSRVSHHTDAEVLSEDLPSWVPRWHRPFSYESDTIALPQHFEASAGLPVRSAQHGSMEASIFNLEGFCFDTVGEVSSVYEATNSPADLGQFIRECRKLCFRDLKGKHSHDWNALARSLIASTNYQGRLAESEDIVAFHCWHAYIESNFAIPTVRNLDPSDGVETVAAAYYSIAFVECCANRRFFKTSHGSIGLGPPMMKTGDYVVILAPAAVPFILRKDDDLYHLVGECYVDGIMFGEAVEQHLDAGHENTLFGIR